MRAVCKVVSPPYHVACGSCSSPPHLRWWLFGSVTPETSAAPEGASPGHSPLRHPPRWKRGCCLQLLHACLTLGFGHPTHQGEETRCWSCPPCWSGMAPSLGTSGPRVPAAKQQKNTERLVPVPTILLPERESTCSPPSPSKENNRNMMT